jgi:hypothetical protein
LIIHLDPMAFRHDMQVRKRLEILERGLRRASDGDMKLGDYAAWLEQAGLAVPSRQTLRLDVERYAQKCDDLIHGGGRKMLNIDVHATRDAVRYFLGEPWLASPLQPRLPSSACRCLLLAMHFREEVEFHYAALPQPGVAPGFKIHRGVPLRTLPGSDSGYMAIWLEQGAVMHINLARVQGRAAFTGRDVGHYRPPPPDPDRVLCVRSGDVQALQRCMDQFAGGVRAGEELRVVLPASLAVMSADFLEAWWRRTATAERQAERTLKLPNGLVSITVEPKED